MRPRSLPLLLPWRNAVAYGAEMRKRRRPLVGARDADHANENARAEPHPLNELHGRVGEGLLALSLQFVGREVAAAKSQHVAADDADILDVAQSAEEIACKIGAVCCLLGSALTNHCDEDRLVGRRYGILSAVGQHHP